MACKDYSGHLLLLFRDYQSPLYHLETSESDGIRDDDGHLFVIIWRFFAASFVIQRQSSPMKHKGSLLLSGRKSSPMACKDKHSRLLPRSRDSMSVDQGYWSLPCYPETNEFDSMQRPSRLSISFIAFKAPRLLLMHLMSFMLFLLTDFAD